MNVSVLRPLRLHVVERVVGVFERGVYVSASHVHVVFEWEDFCFIVQMGEGC